MRHPDAKILEQASESTLFMALRWNEFFDQHTIDTFQPKLCNISSLLEEIESICCHRHSHGAWEGHLPALQEELSTQSESAFEQGWISRTDYWRIQKIQTATSCVEVEPLVGMLLGENFRQRFESSIIASAKNLPNILPKKKIQAERILEQLATISLHRGYLDFATIDAQMLKKTPQDWIDGLITRIQSGEKRYFTAIELIPNGSESREKIIHVISNSEFELEIADDSRWSISEGGSNRIIVSIATDANSPSQALSMCIRKIEPLIDMLAFYMADAPAEISNQGWVGSDKKTVKKTDIPKQKLRLVQPHGNAEHLVTEAIKANFDKRFDGSLSNALDLHSNAMTAQDVRTRFLNLWAALECLASLQKGSSVIQRICALTTPIVTWRKVEKLARYCAINIHIWARTSKKDPRNFSPFETSNPTHIPATDVLKTLCKPNMDPDMLSLLELTSGHCLLTFRVHEAWKTLNNPKSLLKSLTLSEKRLSWHIRRIYRARNLLVHQGHESPHLEYLCDNLHYYVTAVLSRIIHGLSTNKNWSPKDAALHWTLVGEYFFDTLKKSPSSLTLGDIFPATSTNKRKSRIWSDSNQNKP